MAVARAFEDALDMLERSFDNGVMAQDELVERWWNGRFGRMSRRDVWLYKQTTWRVQSRIGDADDGRGTRWDLDNEQDARTLVQRLLETGGDGWTDLTGRSDRSRPPSASAGTDHNG